MRVYTLDIHLQSVKTSNLIPSGWIAFHPRACEWTLSANVVDLEILLDHRLYICMYLFKGRVKQGPVVSH